MDRVSPQRHQVGREQSPSLLKQITKNDKDVKRLYSDGSGEIASAAKKLGWRHDVSTPQRPETNGAAERAVRRTCDGTRASLLQSGLHHRWWKDSVKTYNQLPCFSNKVRDGKTPYELRHKTLFKGQLIPFGCAVSYKPSSFREFPQTQKFGP